MKKPKVDRFDPKQKQRIKPEEVDLTGVPEIKKKSPLQTKPAKKKKTVMIPRYHDTEHDTTIPRYHDATIETIRKAVKQLGREPATHRFTSKEKKAITGIIYTYKQQGIITSENQITRAGINFLLNDYEENGKNSILALVLKRLNE